MKRIKTKHGSILVDDEDYAIVAKYKWWGSIQGKHVRKVYARTGIKVGNKAVSVSLHRMLMDLETGNPLQVDHINGNGLDNRRKNLRVCTRQQNNCNRQVDGRNKYGQAGICYFRGFNSPNKWLASIGYKGKCIHIGLYRTKREATKARKLKENELFGEFSPSL